MFARFGSGLPEEKEGPSDGVDDDNTPRTRADLLEELQLMYPDAPLELLAKAARRGGLEEACDAVSAGLNSAGGGYVQSSPKIADCPLANMEALRKLETMLPMYDADEVRGIFLSFGSDFDAAYKRITDRPDQIERMVRNGLTIEEVEQAEAQEQVAQEQHNAQCRLEQMQAAREKGDRDKSGYTPDRVDHAKAQEHYKELVRSAATNTGGHPSCWDGTHGIVNLEQGQEFVAVATYFAFTLGYTPAITCIARLQNYEAYDRFKGDTGNTLMFHGCKADANERSIALGGFQVQKCKSDWHGKGQGSWFAFNASYSDNGFVFPDKDGIRHIFLCIVSTVDVRLENSTMRVVGQDCAVPLWIITFTNQLRR